MSLNWDVSKVKDWKDLDPTLRDTIIWATLVVDLGEITEKNWEEFYIRVHVWEGFLGAFLVGPDGPVPIKPDQVKRMIGMNTNVGNKTRRQWMSRLSDRMDRYLDDLRRSTQRVNDLLKIS